MTILMLADSGADRDTAWRPNPAPYSARESVTRRILLVEDDPFVRGYVARLLTEAGYDVVTAANGAEALHLATDATRFDLVITDVRMPIMDGRELGYRLGAVRPDLPVIFLSGYDTAVDSLPLPADGRQVGFLAKPFEPGTLLSRVYSLIGSPEAL